MVPRSFGSPAEIAVHPADSASGHELFLLCDNVEAFVEQMTGRGVACAEPSTERWGSITRVTLPGGGTLGVYQPSHPSPLVRGADDRGPAPRTDPDA